MGYEVREIRQTELDEAIAFAQAHGGSAEAAAVRTGLSLIASEAGQPVGVLLALKGDDGGFELELSLEKPDNTALAQTLMNIILLKMRCQHIGKLRVNLPGDPAEGTQSLWQATRWLPDSVQPEANTPDAVAA